MLKQIKTDAFEATVTPYAELPMEKQMSLAFASQQNNDLIVFAMATEIFREQLAPDKLAEFNTLSMNEVTEIVTKFLDDSVCSLGHTSKAQCNAFNDGGRQAAKAINRRIGEFWFRGWLYRLLLDVTNEIFDSHK